MLEGPATTSIALGMLEQRGRDHERRRLGLTAVGTSIRALDRPFCSPAGVLRHQLSARPRLSIISTNHLEPTRSSMRRSGSAHNLLPERGGYAKTAVSFHQILRYRAELLTLLAPT